MSDALVTIAIRLALCAAVLGGGWYVSGARGLLFASLPCGLLLARPLLELAIAVWQRLRHENWKALEGRHFAYKGRTVHVEEDAEHRRWIRLADVRAIAGFTASDAALKVTYPKAWSVRGKPPSLHLGDEALLVHLGKERSPEALRFTRWVEREIVFPARRQREHGRAAEAQPRIRSTSDVVE